MRFGNRPGRSSRLDILTCDWKRTLSSSPSSRRTPRSSLADFPCQDLSQAGATAGIGGKRSGLVGHVFRLLDKRRAPWVVLENVSFMLHLDSGKRPANACRSVRGTWLQVGLSGREFDVLLTAKAGACTVRRDDHRRGSRNRAFRRRRDPSRTEDLAVHPCARVLLDRRHSRSRLGSRRDPDIEKRFDGRHSFAAGDFTAERKGYHSGDPGRRAVPGVRGRTGRNAATSVGRASPRWSLVGNAVTVPVAKWLGERLVRPGLYATDRDRDLAAGARWPKAARFDGDQRWRVEIGGVSGLARRDPVSPTFCTGAGKPLSARAARGFLSRTERSSLRFPPGFLERIRAHLRFMEGAGGQSLAYYEVPAVAAE